MSNHTDQFQRYEVAYRIPGESWKRKIIKSQFHEDLFFDMVEDEGAEVRYAAE